MTNDNVFNALTQPLLADRAAGELRALLCGPKAPKTSRGREAQTVKMRNFTFRIFRDITPQEIHDACGNSERYIQFVTGLMDMVWERHYLVSSQGDRVVQEVTEFSSMCRKYLVLCEVALMGKNLLGPKSDA